MSTSSNPSSSTNPPPERRNLGSLRTTSTSYTSTPTGTGGGAAPSPHTPQRQLSGSSYSSPGTYRSTDEECVIIELGARYLRAGLAGEVASRATLTFDPSQARRVGDYREWLPGYRRPDEAWTKKSTESWGASHELWPLDIRHDGSEDDVVGLVEDKVDRAVRDAFDRHLLLDSKSRKVALVLPAVLPAVYVERVLLLLYRTFEVPAISLFPQAAMAVVGAGLRAGLVVDIGWNETVVTAVYELRHVVTRRSTRAVKLATLHTARLLTRRRSQMRRRRGTDGPSASSRGKEQNLEESLALGEKKERLPVAFEDAEATFMRVCWCQSLAEVAERRRESSRPSAGIRQISGSWPADTSTEEGDDSTPSQEEEGAGADNEDDVTALTAISPEDLPFQAFSKPVESAFFANSRPAASLDDHETALPQLIYDTMVALPPDVRGACVSRIIFTGGGANVPGLKSRLTAEVGLLINTHGFDPVRGEAADKYRRHLAEISSNRRRVAQEEASRTRYPPNSAGLPAGETPAPIPAGLVMPEIHPIDEKLVRDAAKQGNSSKGITGIFRAVETLGAFAGTSLAISSKIKAVVEVTMEEFMKDGMLGAAPPKTAEITVGRVRSYPVARDAKSWTLGLWA